MDMLATEGVELPHTHAPLHPGTLTPTRSKGVCPQSLEVGVKVWGMVQEVSARGLTISLPHGLRGTVAPQEVGHGARPGRGSRGVMYGLGEGVQGDDVCELVGAVLETMCTCTCGVAGALVMEPAR